jgi:hypothetical protein
MIKFSSSLYLSHPSLPLPSLPPCLPLPCPPLKITYHFDVLYSGTSKKRRSNAKGASIIPTASIVDKNGSISKETVGGAAKTSKGLRHFSMKVCEKVREKGSTTYNEVADELVEEFSSLKDIDPEENGKAYDEKNIRRRVYDALNVLMAMDIIGKQKKEIVWKGLPSSAVQDISQLQSEKMMRADSIVKKTEILQELLLQQIAVQRLILRNKESSKHHVVNSDQKIPLPFIVVNTSQDTEVKCEMGEDRSDIFFSFSQVITHFFNHIIYIYM